MDVVIKMSPETYRRLRDGIPAASPAREPIEMATPINHSVEGVTFAGYSVGCSAEQARIMREYARRHYPEAVPEIDKALTAAGSR